MKTATLLPYVRVATYDLRKNRDLCFPDQESADAFIRTSGAKCVNVYRIEKVNGTWRTDWELSAA